MTRPWVSLFSGGKDSSWALFRALETGRPVESLLTVHPPDRSYLYHVPATQLAQLAADSIGLVLHEVEVAVPVAENADSAEQAERELNPLEARLREIGNRPEGMAGITAGAVASEYQARRLEAMCDRLGCELYTPLWGAEPIAAGRAMVDAGFDIRIIAVAAGGLEAEWLGRQLDHDALDELVVLSRRDGVHPLGEGGEYETLVVDGPHMSRRIRFESSVDWAGDRGELVIEDAWLE